MAKRRTNKVTDEMRQAARRRAEAADRGFTPTSIKFPNDLKLFQVKSEGIQLFDIVPYTAGAGNPNAEKGSLYFERTYYVHRGVGVNSNSYICPAKVYGKKCPICSHIVKLEREGADKQTIDALRPKNRQLFLVYDRKEPEAGLKLLDSSYHLFGKLLDDRVLEPDAEEEGWAYYWFPNEEGKTLRVNFKQETFGGRAFFKASSIDFKPRKEALPDEILEHGYCLDDMLIQVDYEELKKKFYEEEDDEEDDEPKTTTTTTKVKSKPAPKKAAPVKDEEEDEDDDWDDEDEDEEEVETEEEDEEDEDDDWDDEEEAAEEDEEEAAEDEEDEDDDWDDDEGSEEEEEETDEEDEDDDWDDDEDEDEPPAKPARTPAKSAATKASKPARATKPVSKPKPAGKPKTARRTRK
jgi:hypothetical protein